MRTPVSARRGRFPALLVIAWLGVCLSPALQAVIVASDTFSITEDRPVDSIVYKGPGGSAIRGTTETGGLTWNANLAADRAWVVKGDATNGYVTRSGASTAAALALPFSFSTYASHGDVATLEVSIKSQKGSDSNGYWYLIAFGNNTNGGNPSGNGLLYLQINPYADTWDLRSKGAILKQNDAEQTPVSGSLSATLGSAYSNSEFYTYSISYNNTTNTVTDVSINGTSVVSDYILSASLTGINTVSFFGQWTNAATQIDSFTISVNNIPEPASYGMILGAGFLAFAFLSRKSRRPRDS